MIIVREIEVIHDKSGFGIIHKVEVEGGEVFARKTFRPNPVNTFSDEDLTSMKKRFSREVRTQERFSSDFCLPIVYSDLISDTPWFLMPLADKTYQDEISASKIENRNVEGLADILNSLEYLHLRGYTHRDIKPCNILYHDGKWKLADMGLITSDPALTTSFKTESGVAFGSLPYMAPEQYTDFQNVTCSADIYSFGAILHDIFNGNVRKPYARLTAEGSIGFIIEKCTEELPENRFNNISILRQVLLSKLSNIEVPKELEDEVKHWLDKLNNFSDWSVKDFDAYITSIERDSSLMGNLFYHVNVEFIKSTKDIDSRHWNRFVKNYLNWVHNNSFNYDYCDVLVGHVKLIYDEAEDLSIVSDAVFTGAELAVYHNRWYCMRKVVEMCSPKIPDLLAERISIEIYANGSEKAKPNLLKCVEALHKTILDYHEEIMDALS
jgi:serine/threonine protein kinase